MRILKALLQRKAHFKMRIQRCLTQSFRNLHLPLATHFFGNYNSDKMAFAARVLSFTFISSSYIASDNPYS